MKSKSKRDKQNKYFEEDSGENFYFIAGYTDGGASYGVNWEEIIAQELNFRGAVKKDAKKAADLIHYAIDDIAEKLTGQTRKKIFVKRWQISFEKRLIVLVTKIRWLQMS